MANLLICIIFMVHHETAEIIHLIIDCVVHSLVLLNSSDPFVHHKWRLQRNKTGS